MKSYEHLVIGGPSIDAWPTSSAGKLRPGGGGGGGGDGGAAQMEADRQQRTKAAIDKINAIFNGSDVQIAEGKAGAYNPGQTYFNADGTQFVVPTKNVQQQVSSDQAGRWLGSGDAGESFHLNTGVQARSAGGDADAFEGYYKNSLVPDSTAINKALQGGLYTGTRTIKGLDRQGMYDDQQRAVTELNQNDVNRQRVEAERQNRFGLARAGLSGGSADVDSNAEINRLENEGLMKATGIGQQAGADLRTADERTRQGLIGMAQSGIDTGQVSQLALAGLDANADNAKSAGSGATVGNVFGDLAQAYLFNQQQQAFQNGYGQPQNRGGDLNSTRTTYRGQIS